LSKIYIVREQSKRKYHYVHCAVNKIETSVVEILELLTKSCKYTNWFYSNVTD